MAIQDPQAFRVLYIEDDERLASMTRRALEAYGLQVDWVADGAGGARRGAQGSSRTS